VRGSKVEGMNDTHFSRRRNVEVEGVKEDTLYTGMEIGFAVNEVKFILSVVKENKESLIWVRYL